MATIIRFDNGTTPRVQLQFDDGATKMAFATEDDTGTGGAGVIFTDAQAQRAVELVRNASGGTLDLDPDNGLIWSIAQDNSSIVTVQKDSNTPQQVVLTAAQTETITGWLITLPNVVP